MLIIVSLLSIQFSRILGQKFNILDHPSLDKIHEATVPRSGGIGILLTYLAGVVIFNSSVSLLELIFLTFVFLIGLADDLISIPQIIKLMLEILGCFIFYAFLGGRLTGTFIIDLLMASLYLVVFINAFNEIDGMDGLAAGIGFISCLLLSFLSKDSSIFVAIACFCFLLFNFHPAKIFMGDGGSLFLGAFIGLTSLKILWADMNFRTIVTITLIYSVPLYDMTFTILRRVINKRSILKPDLEHFYNKLYYISNNYVGTVLLIYLFSLILGIIGLIIYLLNLSFYIIIAITIWIALFYVGYKIGFLRGANGKDPNVCTRSG